MRIVVLGAGGPAGVNLLHALALAAHDLVAVDAVEEHLSWCELYADTLVHAPELTPELVNGLQGDVVIAVPDVLVRWLAEHRDGIEAAVFQPPLETIERCQDKLAAVGVWAKAGLRSDAMLVGEEVPDWLKFAEDRFGLPFWLRATRGAGARGSCLVSDLREGFHWVRYWQARGAAEVAGKSPAISCRSWQWMAEEHLPGRDYAWTGWYLQGDLVSSFARERLEYIYPSLAPSGLTGTPVRARVVHDEIVNAVAEQAVKAVDRRPTGVFSVDLREDARGVPRPTEINPGRAGTTTGLWATAGPYNFAHLAARLAVGDWGQLGHWPTRNALPEGLELRRHIDCDPLFVQAGVRVAA